MNLRMNFIGSIVFLFYSACSGRDLQTPDCRFYSESDSIRIESLLYDSRHFVPSETNPIQLFFGESLIGTPYVAHTLEYPEEKLVIDLSRLDCMTFVENVLALTQTAKGEDLSWQQFARKLQQIRYREGHADGYASRLHYSTDWIARNSARGFIRDITASIVHDSIDVSLYFMSNHAEKYQALSQNREEVERIKAVESKYQNYRVPYIPKEKLNEEIMSKIPAGAIIAITTSIAGLDIAHLGIACRIDGELHLLHASLGKKQVVIEPVTLDKQLARYKTQTGIRVLEIL